MNEIEKKENALTPITTNGEIIEYFSREEINMVLQALQEKAERDKGCEYCKERKPILDELGDLQIDDTDCTLWFTSQVEADDIYEDHTKINYCPMCGRKLSDHIGEANEKVKEEK